jgi:sulfate permease, SulP family
MIARVFPFLEWLKDYGLGRLRADAVAGMTVALVLIPQSMAYAQLAGLPAYYGLYAAFLPPMLAALFGSSRQLATGPVAIVSLMTAASLAPLATVGSEGYIAYAILLALMVGAFQLCLGVLRLGLVVNFLSHPVVNGFTNAGALIIASSQLSKMFGISVDSAEHHYETILHVIQQAWHYTHWPTLLMGAAAFVIMYGLKRISPKIPYVLVAVAATTLISWAAGFQHDTVVGLSAIQSPKATGLISQFNAAVGEIAPLEKKRTEIYRAMEEAKQRRDALAILNAEYEANVVSTKMKLIEQQLNLYRTELRALLFEGASGPDNRPSFYLKEELPPNITGDGRTWRLKVGNRLLNTEKLTMTGGGEVVGVIPPGLPSFTLPKLDFGVIIHLLPAAAIISLLGFMEAISIAKAMAAKTGQRLDPNQELIGQGLANICGAIAKSYPTSGSFSRSAVNLQSGAETGLSSVFTSLAVVAVLLFFTPLLYYLPQSVLAAVIMMAVIGLVNVGGFIHAWRAQWYDGAISVISFVSTLLFAPELDKGIMIGVVLSLLVFLYKSMRPTVASLSWHEEADLRDSVVHNLQECEYIDLIRFEGSLFFANASYLEDQINDRLMAKKKLKHIIIAANGINDMDASGEEMLSLVVDRVRSAGVDISLTNLNETVLRVLERTFLYEKIGRDHIFPSMERAICSVHSRAHMGAKEDSCPLTVVCELVNHMMRREN